MNNQRIIPVLVAVVWGSCGVVTGVSQSNLPNPSAQTKGETVANSLTQLRQVIADGGVTGLIGHVTAHTNVAPRIYSHWYVTRLGTNDLVRVEQEQARRDFGLELARALEVEARRVGDLTDIEARAQAVESLLRLERWIAQPEGYGNEWLSYRCQDIASVPLAYLVADVACPTQRLDQLIQLFPPEEITGPRRVRVLNGEIGREVFPLTDSGQLVTTEFVQSKWREMLQPFLKGLEPLWSEKRDHPVSLNDRHNILAKMPRSASDLPSEWQFLWDDERYGDLNTVVGRWSMKQHEWLTVLGRTSSLYCQTCDLYEYRKRVGPYPVLVSVSRTEVDEAFKKSVEQLQPRELRRGPIKHYSEGASVFWRVLNRNVMDKDSWKSASFEQEQQRLRKIEEEKRLRAEALANRTNTPPISITTTNRPSKLQKPILEPPHPPTNALPSAPKTK